MFLYKKCIGIIRIMADLLDQELFWDLDFVIDLVQICPEHRWKMC